MHDASPSVDRINPHLGYVPGNVQVISYKANSMKRNCTMEELLMFAETVLSKHKITDAVPGEKHNV